MSWNQNKLKKNDRFCEILSNLFPTCDIQFCSNEEKCVFVFGAAFYLRFIHENSEVDWVRWLMFTDTITSCLFSLSFFVSLLVKFPYTRMLEIVLFFSFFSSHLVAPLLTLRLVIFSRSLQLESFFALMNQLCE